MVGCSAKHSGFLANFRLTAPHTVFDLWSISRLAMGRSAILSVTECRSIRGKTDSVPDGISGRERPVNP